MAEFKPFQGILYNTDKVDIAKEIALPYDKIYPEQLKAYQETSEYNIANVILGQDKDSDTDDHNKYTRAADYIQKWMKDGILKDDDGEHFYVYEEEFIIPGVETVTRRTALVGMVHLEEFNKKIVLPHERTLAGPKADRLKLMQHTGMNFGQIFGIYKDELGKIASLLQFHKEKKPYFDVTTPEENLRHRLWILDDESDMAIISNVLSDKQFYIADGHHRYTTAINYRDELKEAGVADDAMSNYRLMSLVDIADEGMIVLPTHRVVAGMDAEKIASLFDKLKDYFDIETYIKREREYFLEGLTMNRSGHHIGLSLYRDENYYLLSLKDNEAVTSFFKETPECIRSLDVAILHDLIFHHLLEMTGADLENQSYLSYVRLANQALDCTDDGEAQATFLLRPTAIEQVIDVADAGEYMPQKSTDFYPKLYTGTVMARVNEIESNIFF